MKVNELGKVVACVQRYQEKLSDEWKRVRVSELREWKVFKGAVLKCAGEVCVWHADI